jgi:hypothetical protein
MRAATTNGANGEMNCMIATCLVDAGRRCPCMLATNAG